MAEAKPQYNLTEIKVYWDTYWKTTGLRYLTNGKWKYDFSGKPPKHINATKAELVRLRNFITFPKFLEKYGKDKD